MLLPATLTNSTGRTETGPVSDYTTTDLAQNIMNTLTTVSVTNLYTTTYTNEFGERESGLVSYHTIPDSQGSIISLTTTDCFCTKDNRMDECLTTVTNTEGSLETRTMTVTCVTSTYADAFDKAKTEVITGVVTTDSEVPWLCHLSPPKSLSLL
jgi:hypothetical protein